MKPSDWWDKLVNRTPKSRRPGNTDRDKAEEALDIRRQEVLERYRRFGKY